MLCGAYFAGGFIDSIAGGGGLITLPAFLLTGVPADLVLGTNKLASSCGMAAALGNYTRSGLVVWKSAKVGVPAVLLGAMLGARAVLFFDSATIGKIVVLLLPLGMLATLMPRNKRSASREMTEKDMKVYLPLVCLSIGFYDGFFGPGAGSFFVLALYFLLGFELLAAAATTKLLNLSAGLSGLFVFMWYGKVGYLLALPLSAASICGNMLGSRLAIRIGPDFVRRVLTVSLFLLFISLIWKFWLGS